MAKNKINVSLKTVIAFIIIVILLLIIGTVFKILKKQNKGSRCYIN